MKKKRLLIYFCIGLALITLLGVSFFYLRKLNALEKNSERVDHSYQVIIQTNLLEQNLLNAETSQRGYLLTDKPDFLESYLAELRDTPLILSTLGQLTADDRLQQNNLDTLTALINMQLNILKNNMVSEASDSIPVARFRQYSTYMDRIRDVISNIKSKETDLLSARNSDKTKNTHDSNTSSFLSLIVAFAMCCIASVSIIWFFNRSEKYRAELEDKLQKLTTLNNEIRQLALVSAHNLQEPMRKMQMIVDWLQHAKGVQDPNLNEQLNRIKDIYGRQQLTNNKIIDYYDILLSRYRMENISLGSFIAKLNIKYNWDLLFKLSVEPLKEVYADPGQLELLFLHLVHNAQQFRHPERLLEIRMHEVAADQQPVLPAGIANREYYCVAVSDNGIGLQQQYLDKIFDLFQKVEVSQENISQSGMGLSFCKRIMLNHGGWIAAGKNDPDGLRILLFFPAN